MNRKVFSIVLIVVVAGLVLAACMNNDAESPQTRPQATADYAPQATAGANGVSGATGNGAENSGALGAGSGMGNNGGSANGDGSTANSADGALTPFDWANRVSEIEGAIARISEISEARVVVSGTTALAGVKFDNAYKGEMTERIREMVASEVLKADPSIQTVAVTASAEDVQKVYALADQIRSGRSADELSADINSIVRNATTLR